MVALVPGHQLGIEMGVILLIFTGQVWNLAFSFYSSMKTIPREMMEAARIYRYSAWQRFWQLEMPFAAIGLVWNSIVSVAGGWFALMLCEMFTMGDRNFQLARPGQLLQSAAELRRRARAALSGIGLRGSHRRCYRPACLASADCLERQIQIRAGGVRRPRHLAGARTAAAAQRAQFASRPRCGARSKSPSIGACSTRANADVCSRSTTDRAMAPRDRSPSGWWSLRSSSPAGGPWKAAAMLSTLTWADMRHCSRRGATFLRVNASLLISAAMDHSRGRGHRPQSRAWRALSSPWRRSWPRPGHRPFIRCC